MSMVTPVAKRLRRVEGDRPGIRRVATGSGFRYLAPSGRPLRDPTTLARIRSLAVPPAWTYVWICPDPGGHIQATGRDARGRKQYRYHADWRRRRDDTKFGSLVAFAKSLPRLRAAADADLRRPGLPRAKVLAAVVQLLDRTKLRVGNAEYVKANGSFGLSTLLDDHVAFAGDTLRLTFRGKSGVWHDRAVSDPRLARVVRRCRDLPGQTLFQYLDAHGEQRSIGSADVNDYIRKAAGGEFTAKVFRTWAGTVRAAELLADRDPPKKKAVVEVVKEVAAELGNTPAVCRSSYIHPRVIAAFEAGELALDRRARRRGLSPDEAAVLKFLDSEG
jgi:DNA topoisomerase I